MKANCRIIRKQIAGHSALFFAYNASEAISFECSLFCEVGQPFIPTFESILKAKGINPKVVEINERPYLITINEK